MKKLLLICLFGVLSCETPRETAASFTYTKDLRTNLCFALYAIGTNGASMTYVPCTEEVEKEIKLEEELSKRK